MPLRRPQRFMPNVGRGARAAEQFCARCGARDVPLQRHHWAPRAVFEDADDWPLSLLCRDCHDLWHRKMGRRPRVKTLGAERLRLLRKVQHLEHEIISLSNDRAHAEWEWSRLHALGEQSGLLDPPPYREAWMSDRAYLLSKECTGIDRELGGWYIDSFGDAAMHDANLHELVELAERLIREM